MRWVFLTKEYDAEGNRVLYACSLREAERYVYLLKERGLDAEIVRDPLRVVAKEKASGATPEP